MQGLVRRFTEYIMNGQFMRANMEARGFKMVKGVADVEFLKDGRSLGTAEAMRPGDHLTDTDFDQVKVTNVMGLNSDFEFYLLSGRLQSDRVLDRVAIYNDHNFLRYKQGGKIGAALLNPTATKRATFAFKCPSTTGSYPFITSRLQVIDAIYTSAPCRVWTESAAGSPFLAWTQVVAQPGGIGVMALNNYATGYAETAAGEQNPIAPAAAIFVNGRADFRTPFVLQPGLVLYVQGVATGAVNVGVEWTDEDRMTE